VLFRSDTAYVLTATVDGSDWVAVENHFQTGSRAADATSGTPTVEVIGTEFYPDDNTGVVSLSLTPVAGAQDEQPWALALADGTVVEVGSGAQETIHALEAEAGDEVCYTLTQYRASGELVGVSDPACATFEAAPGECSCAAGGAGAPALGLLGLLLLRRRRA
jgi:MYXO-CTERM domain-containing protein